MFLQAVSLSYQSFDPVPLHRFFKMPAAYTHTGFNHIALFFCKSIKNLNREKIVKSDEISNTYKNDVSMRNSKLEELQTSYDNQLTSILNPKQKEAYASYKTSNSSYTALEEEKK